MAFCCSDRISFSLTAQSVRLPSKSGLETTGPGDRRVDRENRGAGALLTDQRRLLGKDHPDVLTSRNNLAYWLGKVGRIDEAIVAFETLLPDQRKNLGDDHPAVMKTQSRIVHMKGIGTFLP